MKKLFTLLILLFFWASSSWATTVQIGTGTTTTSYFPIYSCYGYNYSQQIYLQSEITYGAGLITKVRFYYNSGGTTYANWTNWTVYLGNTAQTSFASTTSWIPVGSMTQVFSGNIPTPVAGTWLEISLPSSFNYTGGNLVVAVDENTAGYSCTALWNSFTAATNRGILFYDDVTNPNPASPPTANYGPSAILSQIQLEMVPATSPILSTVPGSLSFGYSPSGTPTASQTYVLSGSNLTAGPIVVTAPTGFQVSSNGSTWVTNFNVTYSPPTLGNTTIWARFNPSGSPAAYSDNITNVGGGASANVGVTGTSLFVFCDAGSDACDEFISRVQVATIDNSSSCDDGTFAYSDYTSISTNMYKTLSYPITVTNGPPSYTSDQCGIWVDWNHDADFYDAGESITVSGGVAVYTASIIPPTGAYEGNVRMRIRIMWTGTLDPCGYASYGEVEDYTINVLPAPTDPIFSITPTSKNYGDCPLNNFSPIYYTQTFTVQNAGPGTLNVSSAILTGGDVTEFVKTDPNTYPIGLTGPSTLQFTVKFNPTTVGAKATTLRIHTTSPDTDHDVPLSGVGIVYPPQNLTGVTTPAYTNDLTWDPPLPEGEIRYDNGFASNWYWASSPSGATDYFYTRFTAPVSGNLDYVALLQRNADGTTDWERIMVCPENGTTNTPDLTAPIATYISVPVNSATGEWKLLQLSPSTALTAGTDFFLVTHWPTASTMGPFVGTDATTNLGRCGWTSDGSTWNSISLAFIMRAYMSTAKGASYTLISGDPNPFLGNLPVNTAISLAANEKGHSEKAGRIPVPGIYKEEADRALLSYTLLRGPSATALTDYVTGITNTYYSDAAVSPSTTYFYGVTALYSGNQLSDTSNVISLTTLALCPAPTALTTTNLTSNGADLGWTDPLGAAWDLYIVPAGSAPPDITTVPTKDDKTDNPYTWAEGTPETAYDWYVRTDCGLNNVDVSTWSGPATFTTSQVPATLPFTENFEIWPDNWTVVNDAQINKWYVGTATAHGGTYSAYISNNGGVKDTFDIVQTSVVHFYRDIAFAGGAGGYSLKFWWKGQGESCCDYLKVFVVDPSTVPVAGTVLTTGQVGATYNMVGTWTEVTLTLPGSYTGSTKRLVFSWRNDFSIGTQPPAAVDDISIVALACPQPTALNATLITPHSANLTWTAGYLETAWEYSYGLSPWPMPAGSGTATSSSTINPISLAESSTYQYWVRAYCNPDYSVWSGPYTFATPSSCPPPTGLTANNFTINSADLGWTAGGSETEWNVQVGLPGFAPGTGTQLLGAYGTANNPWTASPLAAGTSYDFYVAADCGFGTPKVDNFWMAIDETSNLIPPFSGGTVDDPYEDGIWNLYDQAPGGQQWYNIWFYNDPVVPDHFKKIRMGFWVQPFNPGQGTLYYVVNWSTPDWPGPNYPTSIDEAHIVRSPINGPVAVMPTDPIINPYGQWVELYFVIPDYNPEWVSVDIWGENITILNESVSPPSTSPLRNWWQTGMPGGLIVHECLPKPDVHTSAWSGPHNFSTQVACPAPTALTATNITTTSADLGWTPGGTETIWNVEVGAPGFLPGTGAQITDVTGTTDNPWTANGLSVSTSYQFYVMGDCGVGLGTSTWSGPYTFTTTCNIVSLPLCESFPTATWPTCWTEQLTGLITSSHWSMVNSFIAGGTAYEARAFFSPGQGATQADNDRMVSPGFNTTGLSSIHLSFRQMLDDYVLGDPDVWIKVQSSSDKVNWTDEWVYAGAGVDGGSIPAEVKTMDITNNLGGTTYIAWTLSGYTYDINYWYVDDVCITAPVTCTTNTWTGTLSNAWDNPGNWSCGVLPDATMSVLIPTGLSTYPEIPVGVTADCFDISVETGANISVFGTLNVVNP